MKNASHPVWSLAKLVIVCATAIGAIGFVSLRATASNFDASEGSAIVLLEIFGVPAVTGYVKNIKARWRDDVIAELKEQGWREPE